MAYAARTLGAAGEVDRATAQGVHGLGAWPRPDHARELALDADGRVLALRVRSVANVGGYAMTVGVAIQLLIGPWVIDQHLRHPGDRLQLTAVMTNATPTGAYRGAGRPEAIYVIERLMDAAAREDETRRCRAAPP